MKTAFQARDAIRSSAVLPAGLSQSDFRSKRVMNAKASSLARVAQTGSMAPL